MTYAGDFQSAFLVALVITLAMEVPLLVLLATFLPAEKRTYSLRRTAFTGLLCTFATLPYLWFILPHYLTGALYFPIGELAVTLVESFIIVLVLRVRIIEGLVASAVCNAFSATAGPFLYRFVYSSVLNG